MSDAFGAAVALLVIAAMCVAWQTKPTDRLRTVVFTFAGALAAYGVLVHVGAIGILGSVAITGRQRRIVAALALGALPMLTFLATYQWTEFREPGPLRLRLLPA